MAAPPLIPTVIAVAGGYILWFSVHYWRDTQQIYPSDPVKRLLTGHGLPPRNTEKPDLTSANNVFAAGSDLQNVTPGTDNTSPTLNPSSGISNEVQFDQQGIENLWTSLGGDPKQAGFAAGVANAESGYNAQVTSSNPDGGTNVGLYQLDTRGVGAGYTVAQLQDPVLNTQITIMATRNGTDWADWADPYISAHGTHGAS